MKLESGQLVNIGQVIEIGSLVGDESIKFYLVEIKIGLGRIAYRLDCDGKGKVFDSYPDVYKPRARGVDWDMTIYPSERDGLVRAREILSKEFPNLDLSCLAA